jgi:hypothetical protein
MIDTNGARAKANYSTIATTFFSHFIAVGGGGDNLLRILFSPSYLTSILRRGLYIYRTQPKGAHCVAFFSRVSTADEKGLVDAGVDGSGRLPRVGREALVRGVRGGDFPWRSVDGRVVAVAEGIRDE